MNAGDKRGKEIGGRRSTAVGVTFLLGFMLLGLGIGLVAGQPGFGLIIGLAVWLLTMGLLSA